MQTPPRARQPSRQFRETAREARSLESRIDIAPLARVGEIEPSATILEGVPTYKTTLYFTGSAEGVRAGMTADIDIETGVREKALAVPQRAVMTADGVSFVRVLGADGAPAEVRVTTGLRGTDGLVEILSGLSAGASVISFERK